MKKIDGLLEKFKGLKNTRLAVRQAAKDSINKIFSIEIPLKSIEFKNKTIIIHHPGSLKTEIIVRQKEILDKINKVAGGATANTIR